MTSPQPIDVIPTVTPRQRSVYWSGSADAAGRLYLIDQRDLPHKVDVAAHQTVSQVANSIKIMLVRGAPAIGAAGAFAMVLASIASKATTAEELLKDLSTAKLELDESRPTAVNLSWATSRMYELAELMAKANIATSTWSGRLLQEAQELADDDVKINKRIGDFGATLVKEGDNLLHHCNTGFLATVDYGTALGVIYSSHAQKKNIHVWVDETRPRLQGSKLTAWELMTEGVPFHLIPDNAAGLLMYSGKVNVIVFGADRVAANGDTANKIGTYKVCVVGRENNIPTYACVPTSTIDLNTLTGKDIVIEERGSEEVTHIGSTVIAPAGCPVFNPAFDVTPAKYISAIITEEGICYPPYEQSLKEAKLKAEERVRSDWNNRLNKYLQQ